MVPEYELYGLTQEAWDALSKEEKGSYRQIGTVDKEEGEE